MASTPISASTTCSTWRGFDSLANGLVLSDGAPEPEATFYQIYNVDRVEALKGPGAFLYGGNPLSGTINLVRKRPDPASDFARVNVSFGSFSTYRATLDAARALSDQGHALRFNALWQDAESYRDDKNSSILAVNPTLRLNLGERSTLHLDFEYLTSEHRSDSGLPIVGGALPDVPRTPLLSVSLRPFRTDHCALSRRLRMASSV